MKRNDILNAISYSIAYIQFKAKLFTKCNKCLYYKNKSYSSYCKYCRKHDFSLSKAKN